MLPDQECESLTADLLDDDWSVCVRVERQIDLLEVQLLTLKTKDLP